MLRGLPSLRSLVVICSMMVIPGLGCRGESGRLLPPEVPGEYADLFAALEGQIENFSMTVGRLPAREGAEPIFGAHLLAADSNRGAVLLTPSALAGVEITLDRMQHLGVRGITLAIGYPLLVPTFPDAGRYLEFYRRVAGAVRRRGMTLAIEQIVLFANSQFSSFVIDFGGLDLARFTREQCEMAQVIVDELKPDFLTVLHEPQTYAVLTGLEPFYDPSHATAYVRAIVDGLDRGATLIGAGAANYDDLAYYEGFAGAGVDYLDMHLYNLDDRSLRQITRILTLARQAGKPLVMSEAWLYKSDGADEAAQANLTGWEAGFRRDVFAFWEPLDIRFHAELTRLGRRVGALYVSPFWSNYYFAYVDHTPVTADLSYTELVRHLAPGAVGDAILGGRFTQTGLRYGSQIVPH